MCTAVVDPLYTALMSFSARDSTFLARWTLPRMPGVRCARFQLGPWIVWRRLWTLRTDRVNACGATGGPLMKFSLGQGFLRPSLRPSLSFLRSKSKMVLRSLFDAQEPAAGFPRYSRRVRQTERRSRVRTSPRATSCTARRCGCGKSDDSYWSRAGTVSAACRRRRQATDGAAQTATMPA